MKMKIYKPIGLLLASALIMGSTFTGCKSKKDSAKVGGETLIEVYCSGPDYRSDKKAFRANSIGESSDQVVARKKASSNAKADLASLIQTTIKGATDNYVNSREFNNVEEVEERFESLTREVVKQQLNNIKVICEKQTMTKQGRYKTYLAIEMSVNALEEALNNKLSKDKRLKVDYDYEKYKDTFDKEMDKLEDEAY
ncbi:MAG: hypothetical protein PF487_12215 [Bacteroidales bacterium]|jgi:hypothetical protein|nr:hypothetical protein [Bacteroidales bacterium]